MDRPPEDSRSIISLAYGWATTIIVIAAEMVVPGVIGILVGQRLGVVAMIAFAILGFVAGMTVAILHLLRITKSKEIKKL